jgi:hypothetical protein
VNVLKELALIDPPISTPLSWRRSWKKDRPYKMNHREGRTSSLSSSFNFEIMENQQPTIEYANKARHGHGNDIVDDNNVRQVAGCLPIDPVKQKVLLITSSNKNNDNWVLVSVFFSLSSQTTYTFVCMY